MATPQGIFLFQIPFFAQIVYDKVIHPFFTFAMVFAVLLPTS